MYRAYIHRGIWYDMPKNTIVYHSISQYTIVTAIAYNILPKHTSYEIPCKTVCNAILFLNNKTHHIICANHECTVTYIHTMIQYDYRYHVHHYALAWFSLDASLLHGYVDTKPWMEMLTGSSWACVAFCLVSFWSEETILTLHRVFFGCFVWKLRFKSFTISPSQRATMSMAT